MPLITVHAGITIHIGRPQDNEYFKLDVEFKDIDTENDLKTQFNSCHKASKAAIARVTTLLDKSIQETLSTSGETNAR